MASKRKSRHNISKFPKGKSSDDFGVLVDPKTSTIHSYQKPDGTWVKAGDQNIKLVTVIDPKYLITEDEKSDQTRETLPYRIAQMLATATKLFGPRDLSYTVAGAEFTNGLPRVRFYQGNYAIIQLHVNALHDRNEMLGQLAHECIHLLSPTPDRPPKILEEGMAEAFAYLFMRDTMKVIMPFKSLESYREALELVTLLLDTDPDGIRKMREEVPTIADISKTLIMKYYPTIPEGVAARLIRTFVRDENSHPDIVAIYNREAQP